MRCAIRGGWHLVRVLNWCEHINWSRVQRTRELMECQNRRISTPLFKPTNVLLANARKCSSFLLGQTPSHA